MQGQRQIKAVVLVQIDNTYMHRLISKEKSLFTSGICKVAKIENPTQNVVYFINMNSFYYTLNKSIVFAKLNFDETVSYIFPHFDNGLSSFTILKKNDILDNFEQVISNAAVLLPFEDAIQNQQFKAKIDEHCPGIQKQPIYGADKIKGAIRETGKLLGYGFKALGSMLATGVHSVGEYLTNKVEQPTEKSEVAPSTKQKWQNLKKGTNNAISVSKQLYSKYLSPIVAVGVDYGKQVVEKIENSENSTVKYAKQLAKTGGQAASTAIKGLAEGATKVGAELNVQSKKIVNKKYGEDYVKTFLPEDSEETKIEQKEEKQKKLDDEEGTANEKDHLLYPPLDEKK